MGIESGSEMEDAEFRIFVGGLSWGTEEGALMEAFQQYSPTGAKIVMNRDSGRSRGFGFVTFGDKRSMDDAIDEMHNKELDGRSITVSVARGERSFGGGRGGRGSFGGDRSGGGGGECFKCGRGGHWARDCPEGGGSYGERRGYGDKGGGRGYGGGGGGYSSSSRGGGYDRDSDRYGGSSDRYGDKYGSGGRSQSGRDRTRSAPYDRPKEGGFRE